VDKTFDHISVVNSNTYRNLSGFGTPIVYYFCEFENIIKLKQANKEGGRHDFSKMEPKSKPV